MLVLLINTFQAAESTLGSYSRLLSPMPPITLAYLAAALEQAGVDVAVHDDMLHGGDEAALDEVLRTRRPDVVGLSVVTALMPGTERIARRVRAVLPEAQIVMGNIHADVFHRQLLLSGLADIVVHGEGEETIVDLVDSFGRADRGLDSVPGISFAEDGEVITTERRPYILDLDSLPFPAWHLFPFEKYRIFNFARVREPGRACHRCPPARRPGLATTRVRR